jgi:hypothetical protein
VGDCVTPAVKLARRGDGTGAINDMETPLLLRDDGNADGIALADNDMLLLLLLLPPLLLPVVGPLMVDGVTAPTLAEPRRPPRPKLTPRSYTTYIKDKLYN